MVQPRDVRGVVLDPAEQGRAASVEPRQSQEVETGRVGDASGVNELARFVEHRMVMS
jgi:hypothetical protein